ncbi:hypothetical protein ACFQ2B_16405 [Streptomyces stramineus]
MTGRDCAHVWEEGQDSLRCAHCQVERFPSYGTVGLAVPLPDYGPPTGSHVETRR